ncbi:MAG: helix-turn-helix domain-containing protein [Kofleriaceae bacterium]
MRSDLPYAEAKAAALHELERRYLADVLARTDGNLSAASRESGIDRKHLRALARKHGLIDGADTDDRTRAWSTRHTRGRERDVTRRPVSALASSSEMTACVRGLPHPQRERRVTIRVGTLLAERPGMTRIAYLLLLAACGGPDATAPSDGSTSDGAGSSHDGSITIAPGTILDSTPTSGQFLRTADVARNLQQFDGGIRTGLTGDYVVTGTVMRGQLFGDVAVATQPANSQVATPPTFCKYDVTTGERVDAFGVHGCVAAPRAYFGAYGIAKVPDGYRAVIQENCSNGCPDVEQSFALVKLNAQGVLDTSFGTAGILYTQILPDLSVIAFAPQSTGDLIVNAYTGLYNMKLLRIHTDGSLDTTFGTAGFVPNANGARVRVLADDSIFLESSYNGVERIDRYTKDGAPLPGWGTNGSVDLETLTHSTFDNNFNHTAADLDADGRVIVGYSRTDTYDGPDKFYVLRLLPTGALDTSFGTAGITQLDPSTMWVYGIGFEPDGRILFGTSTHSGATAGHIQP